MNDQHGTTQHVRTAVLQEVIEAIKIRRGHYIACGVDLNRTAGMYEAIRIVQELLYGPPLEAGDE